MKNIAFIGSAFGQGAQITTTSLGPNYIKNEFKIIEKLNASGIKARWCETIFTEEQDSECVPKKGRNFRAVLKHNKNLFKLTNRFVKENTNEIPFVIGGDHSCAIGTWSGIINALNANENFGLIWIDAHMDAHVYETSPSKAYHGMPLSVLLGYGDDELLKIGNSLKKIHPKHLVLIGVRSYEPDEVIFLESLGVKIFTREQTISMGLSRVFKEALKIVTNGTKSFGISFDLDAIDPLEAPGVGSPEPDGLTWKDIKENLFLLFDDLKFRALEVTEFNPEHDNNDLTASIIFQISCLLGSNAYFTNRMSSLKLKERRDGIYTQQICFP